VRSRASGSLVSVVLPTRNRPAALGSALRSVLEQTYRNLEVVVVDDASEPDVAEVVERAAGGDPRVVLTRLEGRSGAARARNVGLERASGELVAFLDDDDLWLPTKLARQVDYLDSHLDVGLVSCDYELSSGGPGGGVRYRGPSAFSAEQVQWMNFPGSFSFVMARRDLLDGELRLDESFPSVEDWDLWLRCGRRARFGVVQQPLVRHVRHGGLSRPGSEQRGLEVFIAKHGPTLPPECGVYLRAHLKMLSGEGWRHAASVARSMFTRSLGVSGLLVCEQSAEQLGELRRDPGLVARVMARLIGPGGRLGVRST
jgi:hypothetical protein